jgi:hypothetical protein
MPALEVPSLFFAQRYISGCGDALYMFLKRSLKWTRKRGENRRWLRCSKFRHFRSTRKFSPVTSVLLSPLLSCHLCSPVTSALLSPLLSCHLCSPVTSALLSPLLSCHLCSPVTSGIGCIRRGPILGRFSTSKSIKARKWSPRKLGIDKVLHITSVRGLNPGTFLGFVVSFRAPPKFLWPSRQGFRRCPGLALAQHVTLSFGIPLTLRRSHFHRSG